MMLTRVLKEIAYVYALEAALVANFNLFCFSHSLIFRYNGKDGKQITLFFYTVCYLERVLTLIYG